MISLYKNWNATYVSRSPKFSDLDLEQLGEFYKSLRNQSSLEELTLGYGMRFTQSHLKVPISPICALKNLKTLNLTTQKPSARGYEGLDLSNQSTDSDIAQICTNLNKLRQLSLCCSTLTDNVLLSLASLHHLNELHLYGNPGFSVSSLHAYISSLQPTNKGLSVSLCYMRTPDFRRSVLHQISYDKEALEVLNSEIKAKVGGCISFGMSR